MFRQTADDHRSDNHETAAHGERSHHADRSTVLNLTRRVDYSLLVLTHLGLRPRHASSAGHVAAAYGLSLSLTANVLKALHRAELVRSRRGAKGGYTLNRRPNEITVADVIRAVEGDWEIVECRSEKGRSEGDGETVLCRSYTPCPIRHTMDALGNEIRAVLERTTLARFVVGAQQQAERDSQDAAAGASRRFVDVETSLQSPLTATASLSDAMARPESLPEAQ